LSQTEIPDQVLCNGRSEEDGQNLADNGRSNIKHHPATPSITISLSEPLESVVITEPPDTDSDLAPPISSIEIIDLPIAGRTLRRRNNSRARSLLSVDLEDGSEVPNDRISPFEAIEVEDKSNPAESSQPRHSMRHQSNSSSSISQLDDSPPDPVVFRAFPELKWFRSIVFAVIGFVIMTMIVLGNLIYT
jgi:hypothetical protein